jgi:hypothetical protein
VYEHNAIAINMHIKSQNGIEANRNVPEVALPNLLVVGDVL